MGPSTIFGGVSGATYESFSPISIGGAAGSSEPGLCCVLLLLRRLTRNKIKASSAKTATIPMTMPAIAPGDIEEEFWLEETLGVVVVGDVLEPVGEPDTDAVELEGTACPRGLVKATMRQVPNLP